MDLLPTRGLVSTGVVIKEDSNRSAAVFPDLSLASPFAPRARSSSAELVFPLMAAMWRAVRPVSAVAASIDAPESRSSPKTGYGTECVNHNDSRFTKDSHPEHLWQARLT